MSWIYVLPLLFTEEAELILGCVVRYPALAWLPHPYAVFQFVELPPLAVTVPVETKFTKAFTSVFKTLNLVLGVEPLATLKNTPS